MKVTNYLLLGANGLFLAILLWLVLSQGLHLHPSDGWEYKDLVSVLLTVVTIVLTFIGLVVALAAIFGWQTISQGATRRASEVAQGATDTHLRSDDFQSKLKVLVEEQVENIKKAAAQQQITPETVPVPQIPISPARGGTDSSLPDETWQD